MLLEAILNIETEKLLYFILAYPQKVVVVKSGEKDVEKHFWAMSSQIVEVMREFMLYKKGKNIDECTQLFDTNLYDNPEKQVRIFTKHSREIIF